MSTTLNIQRSGFYRITATRSCGPAHESLDRIRVNLFIDEEPTGRGTGISLTRDQWNSLVDAVDDGFMEFPVKEHYKECPEK